MPTVKETPILLPFEPQSRKRVPEGDRKRPIWEIIVEMAKAHPEEELKKIPHDAALNHDHYLYGAPKKDAE